VLPGRRRVVAHSSGRRILVVDDYADVRTLVAEILALQGHDAIQAADGDEAVRCVRALGPDLVVLDLNLPVVDGWGTAARIRALSDAPLLFLADRAEDAERRHRIRVGPAGFMLKPFLRRELVDAVATILSAGRLARAG
jgi:two-component system OmpR family response regulator